MGVCQPQQGKVFCGLYAQQVQDTFKAICTGMCNCESRPLFDCLFHCFAFHSVGWLRAQSQERRVCVCVCVRARHGESERDRVRQSGLHAHTRTHAHPILTAASPPLLSLPGHRGLMTAAIELWSRLLVLEPVRPCGMPRWVRPQVLCRCVALPTCFRLRLLLNSLRSLTFPPLGCRARPPQCILYVML